MLLQYAVDNKPFDHPDYFASLKLDGIRLLVSNMDALKLYTKNMDVTFRFPELHNPPISKGTILDGELIVTDEKGHPDFEAMMARFHSRKAKHRIQFCAFDILYYRGENVMGLPLERRLELLESELTETKYYSRMRVMNGSAVQFFELVKSAGLEGIVLKKWDSLYQTRIRPCDPGSKAIRSWAWQKVINYDYADVVITGYAKEEHEWLIGEPRDGHIKPLGSIKLGITAQHRKAVWPRLKRSIVGENKQFVFVDPVFQCRVKHRGFYKSGRMRLPVLEAVIG
ncbi:DNA ligase [Paenibacillus sp. 7124]|uniref:DNA ligase n=2 Tax=Paenibacillus apii TaxID=1850370 RepID=A0A6M1PM80_9BACL|nr:DNA ligase [Paenibacillus apii]NJJ38902.1 DNA ligase [Paenibacillus apii]